MMLLGFSSWGWPAFCSEPFDPNLWFVFWRQVHMPLDFRVLLIVCWAVHGKCFMTRMLANFSVLSSGCGDTDPKASWINYAIISSCLSLIVARLYSYHMFFQHYRLQLWRMSSDFVQFLGKWYPWSKANVPGQCGCINIWFAFHSLALVCHLRFSKKPVCKVWDQQPYPDTVPRFCCQHLPTCSSYIQMFSNSVHWDFPTSVLMFSILVFWNVSMFLSLSCS